MFVWALGVQKLFAFYVKTNIYLLDGEGFSVLQCLNLAGGGVGFLLKVGKDSMVLFMCT